MSNLTTLTIEQLLYFNGISTVVEVDNKKNTYSIEINYTTEDKNLITSKIQLVLKFNKKIITVFNFDKLLLVRDDKNNFAGEIDLSVFDNLLMSIAVEKLNRVDQNLFILSQLILGHIQDDQDTGKIVPINKSELYDLVIKTGKELETLNIQHTLEFSRLYRFALRQQTKK